MKLKDALKNSVKNSFFDLQKHIKSEGTDVVAIFKVFTDLDKNSGATWAIVHEPSHHMILTSVESFMKRIRLFTKDLRRLEVSFREVRQ